MLTHVEIHARERVLNGRSFGDAGPYESVYGVARFAVDPRHEANVPIVDLANAPRDPDGRVVFRADIWILKPEDPRRGNGALLYHVVNRGRKGLLQTFNLADGSNHPDADRHFGDGFLMARGYTAAAVGWQADVPAEAPDNPHLMALHAPAAALPGGPVTGPVATEIVVDAPSDVESLGSRYHIPYEPVDLAEESACLTVRDHPLDTPTFIPRDRWQLVRLDDGRPAACYPEGFVPGRIYNVIYTGRDPVVMGLGFAATRDFVSYLRHDARDAAGAPNPLASSVPRTLAYGSSQSGRFLRHLLYLGFNADEQGRRVFDGLLVNVAGAGMGSFNHRFAQPSRHACTLTDTLYLTERPPFTDLPQPDAVTGRREGLLDRCVAHGCVPKVFYTNTSVEYWNRGASLIHTTVDGRGDAALPGTSRIYHFTGTQHSPGALPGGGNAIPPNPVNFRLGHRALLVALDAWVRDGVAPPDSTHGTVAGGTLDHPPAEGGRFPDLPGLPFPAALRRPAPLGFGPRWEEEGVIDREPPKVGPLWPVFVPAVDHDGNEVAGVGMPEVAVPLGTFTGWRYRPAGHGASWALAGLQGMWVPFAATKAARKALDDPRPSIEERYENRDAYLARVRDAAQSLIARRFMLEDDIPLAVDRAAAMYDWAVSHPKP